MNVVGTSQTPPARRVGRHHHRQHAGQNEVFVPVGDDRCAHLRGRPGQIVHGGQRPHRAHRACGRHSRLYGDNRRSRCDCVYDPHDHGPVPRFIRPGVRVDVWVSFRVCAPTNLACMGSPKASMACLALALSLAQKALPNFQGGNFDTAVFQAFKEVEVRVREAAQYGDEMYGVNLMRSAFDVQDGPLRDDKTMPSERQAMSDLFAGAIGLLKNPTSHRFVDFTDPQEASEALLLTNHLLRIVEGRASL